MTAARLARWRRLAPVVAGLALVHGMPAGAAGACTASLAALDARALPKGWRVDPHAGQVQVPAGRFTQGSEQGYADERPSRAVEVGGFWIDRTEVTNAQFASFVRATGHVTQAEKQGGSAVFVIPTAAQLQRSPMAWWRFMKGADWRHPTGPGSGLQGRARHPVVHVTQADALAYARWLGRDLPTEAEWEYAAKAGQAGLDAAPRNAKGRPGANYWQGNFPLLDTAEDGHAGVAPVGCYAANAWGLYDTIGNVWEWTKDAYAGPVQGHGNGDPSRVAAVAVKLPPASGGPAARQVIKGGSYLCSPDYCVRYRASARESQEPDLATSHVGFRTVSRDAPRP